MEENYFESEDFAGVGFDFDVEELEDISSSRTICSSCERPQRTCWCCYLPKPLVDLDDKIQVIILQVLFNLI
jgi:hypothetical protein